MEAQDEDDISCSFPSRLAARTELTAVASPILSLLTTADVAAFGEAYSRDDAVGYFVDTYEDSAKFLRRTPAGYMSYLRSVVFYASFLQNGQTLVEHVRDYEGTTTRRTPGIRDEEAIVAYKPAVPTTVYAAESEASHTR